jgi:glycosyltransferase involved in cell wall biosynthesis
VNSQHRRWRLLEVVADGSPGGGTTVVLGLCYALSKAPDYEVHLVTDAKSYAAGQARKNGIIVHEVDFFSGRIDPHILLNLRSIVKQICPDLVHAHGARAGFPIALLHRMDKFCPYVYTVHGYHFRFKKHLLSLFGSIAERLISHTAAMTVFVGEHDHRLAMSLGLTPAAQTGMVIYNGIEHGHFWRQYANDEKCYDMAFIGRLTEQKNVLFLVDIMKELSDLRCNMVIIGGGEHEHNLLKKIEDARLQQQIYMAGIMPREEALRLLSASRLLVFPSVWEGFPVAPLEAMALGLPVVASDIGGTNEIVRSGETGFLLPRFEAPAYGAAIRQLLTDESKRLAFGRSGRERVMSKFSFARTCDLHMRLYDSLLPSRASC